MKRFFIENGESNWYTIAEDVLIKDGLLIFTTQGLIVSSFNFNGWQMFTFVENVERL